MMMENHAPQLPELEDNSIRENGRSDNHVEEIHYSKEFAVSESMLNSREWLGKIQSLSDDPYEQRQFVSEAKEILKDRSGSDGEDISVYNRTRKEWYRYWEGNRSEQVIYSKKFDDQIKKHVKDELVSFHNHPNSQAPSNGDINSAWYRGYSEGYVLGHNGAVYRYGPCSHIIPSMICGKHIAVYDGTGYTDIERSVYLMRWLSKEYKFVYEEVENGKKKRR